LPRALVSRRSSASSCSSREGQVYLTYALGTGLLVLEAFTSASYRQSEVSVWLGRLDPNLTVELLTLWSPSTSLSTLAAYIPLCCPQEWAWQLRRSTPDSQSVDERAGTRNISPAVCPGASFMVWLYAPYALVFIACFKRTTPPRSWRGWSKEKDDVPFTCGKHHTCPELSEDDRGEHPKRPRRQAFDGCMSRRLFHGVAVCPCFIACLEC
jgi:hypothetical protein